LDKKTARNLTTTGLRVVHFYMVACILFGSITGMQVSMLTLTLDLKSIVDGIAKIYYYYYFIIYEQVYSPQQAER